MVRLPVSLPAFIWKSAAVMVRDIVSPPDDMGHVQLPVLLASDPETTRSGEVEQDRLPGETRISSDLDEALTTSSPVSCDVCVRPLHVTVSVTPMGDHVPTKALTLPGPLPELLPGAPAVVAVQPETDAPKHAKRKPLKKNAD
jgi:hypothetical protein